MIAVVFTADGQTGSIGRGGQITGIIIGKALRMTVESDFFCDKIQSVVGIACSSAVVTGHFCTITVCVVLISCRVTKLVFCPCEVIVFAISVFHRRAVGIEDFGCTIIIIVVIDRGISVAIGNGSLTVCISQRGNLAVAIALRNDTTKLVIGICRNGMTVFV